MGPDKDVDTATGSLSHLHIFRISAAKTTSAVAPDNKSLPLRSLPVQETPPGD